MLICIVGHKDKIIIVFIRLIGNGYSFIDYVHFINVNEIAVKKYLKNKKH